MVQPPLKEMDYNFSQKLDRIDVNGQEQQPIIINEEIFKNRIKDGFFIEAGAFDGETFSNTLFFELKKNWTGLLVEPNPDAFEILQMKVSKTNTVQKALDKSHQKWYMSQNKELEDIFWTFLSPSEPFWTDLRYYRLFELI